MQEIWKDIPGYEGKYQISNLGNVMSLHFKRSSTNKKLLKPIKNNGYGYLRVTLRKDGKYKAPTIHRLVAQAFIPNPENKPQVNHLDCNPENNKVTNLEWVTREENVQYGYSHGNMKASKSFLGRTGSKHPLSKPIFQVDISTNKIIKEFAGINEASRITGVSVSGICSCCKGDRKTAGGYIWKYKGE